VGGSDVADVARLIFADVIFLCSPPTVACPTGARRDAAAASMLAPRCEEVAMPARRPEELDALFEDAMNAGDLDRLVELYEPGGSLVYEPGKIAVGTDAIRDALRAFLAGKPRLRITARVVGEAGEFAFTSGRWSMEATGPDGAPAKLEGQSVEFSRRQADGTWRFVLDAPFGAA
jgi:uncharacterized protein (TIGR02246 family)